VDLHDFGAAAGGASDKFLTFQIPASAGMDLVLRWDEPGNGSFAQGTGATGDLDLFLVDSTALPITVGAIRGSSRNVQGSPATPAGSPLEFISYVNSTGITQTVHVIVDHFSGRVPSRVHLSVFADSSIIFTDRASCQDFSSFGHPNGVNVVGVAASFYGEIDSGGLLDAPGGQIDVESFSSKGGAVPLLIGDNGVRLVSPETRSKPELTAPDGGNNSFFGSDIGFDLDAFPNFFGTSAAAPHAAAAAALVWSARPSLTANQVLNALRTTARDIETAGRDVLSGSGLIDTNAAIQSVLPAGVDDWSLFEN
jgi:subtilisin family serine protease